jgi:hypothetical protein
MFAAIRLRHGYKSKRPKETPRSLPFSFIDPFGFNRRIKVPAKLVPRYWLTFVMAQSPGIILGIPPTAPALGSAYWQWHEQDIKELLKWYPGYQLKLEGAGEIRDLARLIAKIAHAMAVAEYGLDAFDPWLPQFILGKDDCSLHYYVAGHANKTVEPLGDHKISLGTWEDDGSRIGATVRLFCRYGLKWTPITKLQSGSSKNRVMSERRLSKGQMHSM